MNLIHAYEILGDEKKITDKWEHLQWMQFLP